MNIIEHGEEEWERRKRYLLRSLFHDQPVLSPVVEESGDWSDRVPSPLPELVVEVQRPVNRHDHTDEFYERLWARMRALYRRLFIEGRSDVSSTDSGDSSSEEEPTCARSTHTVEVHATRDARMEHQPAGGACEAREVEAMRGWGARGWGTSSPPSPGVHSPRGSDPPTPPAGAGPAHLTSSEHSISFRIEHCSTPVVADDDFRPECNRKRNTSWRSSCASKRCRREAGVQTERPAPWEGAGGVFVGTPRVYNLCRCVHHVCR